MLRTIIALALALALALAGCKQDRAPAPAGRTCQTACAELRAEDDRACGDAACRAEAAAKQAACERACTATTAPRGPEKSHEEEVADAEARCASGDAGGCATIGGAYLLGKGGLAKDEAKGAALLLQSCTLGSAFGCELYGRALEEGRGMPADRAKALEFWDRACKGGAGGACRSVGLALADDDPKRIPLFEVACGKDDQIGCMVLGAAYLHGNQGAPKNLVKAKQFLQKACDLGAESACDKARGI